MSSSWASDDLIEKHGSLLRELKSMGMGRRRIARHITEKTGVECGEGACGIALGKIGLHSPRKRKAAPIEIKEEPAENLEQSIEDLLASRIEASQRKISKSKRHRKTLELPAEPVGIMVFGDPHLDNDGCDIATLHDHVTLASQTEGVLAACVGDHLDNWIGRLGRLYANSSITASDGWRLSEWFLESMQWIAIVGGNHDAWANGPGVDPLAWLSKKCGVLAYAPDEIRMTLTWKNHPELEPLVWVCRHDFSGRSWYHATHGPNKEAMLDGKCHILTAGHIHQWGELTTEQRHGRVTNAIRVRGYKRADAFAMQKGFSEQEHGEAVLLVIDPFASGPGRVQAFWDIKMGCEFLTMLRRSK